MSATWSQCTWIKWKIACWTFKWQGLSLDSTATVSNCAVQFCVFTFIVYPWSKHQERRKTRQGDKRHKLRHRITRNRKQFNAQGPDTRRLKFRDQFVSARQWLCSLSLSALPPSFLLVLLAEFRLQLIDSSAILVRAIQVTSCSIDFGTRRSSREEAVGASLAHSPNSFTKLSGLIWFAGQRRMRRRGEREEIDFCTEGKKAY